MTMICNAYNNLGTVVDLLKDPQTALGYHRQALEIATETGAGLRHISRTLSRPPHLSCSLLLSAAHGVGRRP